MKTTLLIIFLLIATTAAANDNALYFAEGLINGYNGNPGSGIQIPGVNIPSAMKYNTNKTEGIISEEYYQKATAEHNALMKRFKDCSSQRRYDELYKDKYGQEKWADMRLDRFEANNDRCVNLP
jgi:hypothetical protein